jgi:hypothetical protein
MKGYSRAVQTRNTLVKTANEFTEDRNKIHLKSEEKFPSKSLLISHENGWRSHLRIAVLLEFRCQCLNSWNLTSPNQ